MTDSKDEAVEPIADDAKAEDEPVTAAELAYLEVPDEGLGGANKDEVLEPII